MRPVSKAKLMEARDFLQKLEENGVELSDLVVLDMVPADLEDQEGEWNWMLSDQGNEFVYVYQDGLVMKTDPDGWIQC